MEARKINEDITVNDGEGLYDSIGIINTLIVDCNELPKDLFNGQYALFCARLAGMVQKLDNLRKGVKNDTNALQARVNELLGILNGGDENV